MPDMLFDYSQSYLTGQINDARSKGAFMYSSRDADAYGSFGISGTTYEIGFNSLAGLLGDLTGMTWLDFGTGAGRSALLLRNLGADFVLGVDHNLNMVTRAKLQNFPGVGYAVIDQIIPLVSESIDGAISCNVYIEIPSMYDMKIVSMEIYRALKPGSRFFIMSANPLAIGHEFKSFSYPAPVKNLSSGARIPCTIKAPNGLIEIEDFYWTRDDYESALRGAGFSVCQVLTPTSSSASFAGTHEPIIGPFIIFSCFKE